jgi:predicted Ser/Thr protein kinase
MTAMTCLSDELVERLCLETCTAEERADCERHLAQCADCQARVQRSRANQGFLAEFKEMLVRQPDKDTFSFTSSTGTRDVGEVVDPVARHGNGITFAPQTCPPIPGYRVHAELHRGGQGTVYHAVQESTRRDVAIKVLRRTAFPVQRDADRFQREVQILAQLKHPGIVTIHDSGTADEQHYFVMDYIAGMRLDDYVAEHQLSPRAILELFAAICDAVNAAHLKGVLHRDLKPSNILVDAQGQPHILDFGLAKLVGDEAADEAMRQMTVTGQFFGSLPWASPEQAAADPARIDLRTDIYSLGVLLYQMLAGRFPYDVTGSTQAVIDRILTAEPAPLANASDHTLNRDVETIVLKCLQKDPSRRYETAGELARDVRRYLAGDPIDARRDSTFYVLRKTLWRHRVATAVTAAVVVLACVGLYFGYEAQLERGQRELLTTMTEQVWPPRDGSIAENVRTATQLRAFLDLEQRQASGRRSMIADRLAEEQQALLDKIERALVLDDMDPLTELFAREPDFEKVLGGLTQVPGGEDILERIAARLTLHLPVPLPTGRGQAWLNTLRMLRAIDPDNPRVAEARRERAALIESLPIRYSDDFSQYDEGERATPWNANDDVERLTVEGAERALLVASTENMTGMSWVERGLPGRTVHIEATLRFEQYADRNSRPYIAVSAEERLPLWTPTHDWLAAHDKAGGYVDAEITYDRVADRCDVIVFGDNVLVDGECVLDGESAAALANWTAPGPLKSFDLVATQGWEIHLDRVVVRSGDAALTAPYGDPVPIIVQDDLGLRLSGQSADAGREPLSAGAFTVGDFDADGRAELVIGDLKRVGHLHVVDVETKPFRWNTQRTLDLKAAFALTPRQIAPRELGILGLGYREPYNGEDSVRRSICEVDVYSVTPEYDLERKFHYKFKSANRGCLTSFRLANGHAGLAVGTYYYRFTVDLFERSAPAPEPCAAPIASLQLRRNLDVSSGGEGVSEPADLGDVLDLLPFDYDGDGDDDLFVGWGEPGGNGPVLILVDNGSPTIAQPITRQIGLTRIALLETPAATYLGAATMASLAADNRPGAGGVRVWRANEINLGSHTSPLWRSVSCDARAIAAGHIAGRDVFAVASLVDLTDNEEPVGQTLRIELFDMGLAEATCVWRADFVDVPPLPTIELAIADVDADGRAELCAAMAQLGFYVFDLRG